MSDAYDPYSTFCQAQECLYSFENYNKYLCLLEGVNIGVKSGDQLPQMYASPFRLLLHLVINLAISFNYQVDSKIQLQDALPNFGDLWLLNRHLLSD